MTTPAPGGTASSVPYRETTRADYAATYTAGLDLTQINEETVVLSGTCPRCGCACTYVHTRRMFRRPRRNSGNGVIPLYCTCATEHSGRPEEEVGCGAYWNVRLERP
ncbi:hypothetical protein E0500_010305 [Streptomyces sp. KM273126]|uniref:hypothetical protein n=1 Tax=Streptomyces sp. KM273126 TaxID=2545247 RepID=UPI00103886CE|nr:hypothetical protein [Streptomyces sp. KM273126]MBA2807791.1 hypothetical protein [Streptomyces sp. KM273126]